MSAPYKLYWASGTGSFVAQLALEAAGAKYEKLVVDTHAWPADYEKSNPMLQVPALILPDGTFLSESVAILLHLADAFPTADLLPTGTSERAECFRWLAFTHANLYETFLRFIYADRYTTLNTKEALRGIRNAAKGRVAKLMSIIESSAFKKSQFVCSDRLSIVDLYLYFVAVTLPKLGMGNVLDACPKVKKLAEVVKERDFVKKVYLEHYPPKSSAKL